MVRIDKRAIGKTVKAVGEFAGGCMALGFAYYLSSKLGNGSRAGRTSYHEYGRYTPPREEHRRYSHYSYRSWSAEYSDAIEAIAVSDMSDYYKNKAIKDILKDADEEYYKSIVSIADSDDMGDYYKYCAIHDISRKDY